jgi:two-component SAPR family response regulator
LKAKKYSEEELNNLYSGNVVDWAKESRNYLEEIYTTSSKIDATYTESNYTIIKSQIQKAGLRLSKILEDSFKETNN